MGPQKFIAANTAEALKLIREHLGPDAMVLSTKDTHEGVEIVAITSEDLSHLSSRSEIESGDAPLLSPFSERSIAQSGLARKFDQAIAKRPPAPILKNHNQSYHFYL